MSGLCLALLLFLHAVVATGAEAPDSPGYQTPPKFMVDLVDAPLTPTARLSPNRRTLLLVQPENLPSIAELAQPELRLAGIRFNPRRYGSGRARNYRSLSLLDIATGTEKGVTGLPAGSRIRFPVSWSADSRYLAFATAGDTEMPLWVVDVSDQKARVIEGVRLNATMPGQPFIWVSDRHELICRTVPSPRGPAPDVSAVPAGPVIQDTRGRKAAVRTFQDLLKNAWDDALFEYFITSQIVRVTIKGDVVKLGKPGLYSRLVASPDGKFVLVEEIRRPFSRIVPASRFGRRIQVWDRAGKMVRLLADLPPFENVAIGRDAVPTGPRNFGWRSDAGATLYWTEARDGGDPASEAEARDEVLTLAAPFSGEPERLFSGGLRVQRIDWGGPKLALVYERWWKTRRLRVWIVRPDEPEAEPRVLFDRSFEDRYGDPGYPVTRRNKGGHRVLHTSEDDASLLYRGAGASPEGDRPFLDKRHWLTGRTTRLWRSDAPYYELPLAPLDHAGRLLLTRRESVDEPPNFFVLNRETGERRQLTRFAHPSPQLRGVKKELIRYQREDGVHLSATLYLPPNHKIGANPLPMLMWAYPREFRTRSAAGQVVGTPYRFTRMEARYSPLFWLGQGYDVLLGPTMPIVGGKDREPNDTYVQQLVSSARAAVEEVVRRGVADPDRIAIGGHSYGAFTTANLLVHSDLFCAGIAENGAYNRTLTPFGFQTEERTLWEAPRVYLAMSPFMHAQKLNEPILLIHGAADNNSGTFPIQSERFYHALKGHGATARLVKLPFESHSYRARESVLHVLWEKTRWLDEHVKNAKPRKTPRTH